MHRFDVRAGFAAHVASAMRSADGFKIPESFVLEFLDFKEKGNGNQCYIPLSRLANWLNTSLKQMSRTLRGTEKKKTRRAQKQAELGMSLPPPEYVEGRDYIETMVTRNGQKGHDFLLTPQCFDKLCMKTNAQPSGNIFLE